MRAARSEPLFNVFASALPLQVLPVHRRSDLTPTSPSPRAERGRGEQERAMFTLIAYVAGSVNVGSLGSGTSTSRSHPSFSSLMCWMATALAFASKSGSDWNSETQQRNTL